MRILFIRASIQFEAQLDHIFRSERTPFMISIFHFVRAPPLISTTVQVHPVIKQVPSVFAYFAAQKFTSTFTHTAVGSVSMIIVFQLKPHMTPESERCG